MPKPAPLRPDQLRGTLVGRFEQKAGGLPGLADNLRQLHTKFGARSRRVFLVWIGWSGDERGEGDPQVLHEMELLPTPKVSEGTAVSRNGFSAGVLPVGSLRIDEISASLAEDTLYGRQIPGGGPPPANVDFYYGIVEDGRSGTPGPRQRYRLYGQPTRRETAVCWALVLERASNDRARDGDVVSDPQLLADR